MTTIGRPSSYRPEYCKLAHNYCLLGATKAQLAQFFEVTSRTIDNWLATIPEFRDEVQRGRNIADAKVADSLYRRAVGYEHEVEGVFGRPGQMRVVRYKKCHPPQTEACIHWLRNRRPQDWGGRLRPALQEQARQEAAADVVVEQRPVVEPATPEARPTREAREAARSPISERPVANRCEESPGALPIVWPIADNRVRGPAAEYGPRWRSAAATSVKRARAPPRWAARFAVTPDAYRLAGSKGRTRPWPTAQDGQPW